MKIIILHGLGQDRSDWINFSEFLDTPSYVLNLFEHIDENSEVTISILEDKVTEELNGIREPFILIGLSLGGYLALNYVSNNNNSYLKKMIVCGAIYKSIPFVIKKIQQVAIKIQSDKMFKKIGLNKNQMLELIETINQRNLTNQLKKIEVPTLVICGEKDRFNLKTSKEIHQLIPHSEFEIIENGKHELNQDSPKELSDIVKKYIVKSSQN